MNKLNLTCKTGEQFTHTFYLRKVSYSPLAEYLYDISPFTYKAELRKNFNDALPTAEIAIAVNEETSALTLTLLPEVTRLLSGVYFWDLLQTGEGVKEYLVGGKINFRPTATKE